MGLGFLSALVGLLGQEDGLNVRQHASLGDGDLAQQLVQLLVVADGQLQVTGDDSRLLVVAGSVPSQLQDLSRQVFEHRCQVDGGASTDALGVVALPQQSVDPTDWKLESCTGRTAFGLRLCFSATFATARHDYDATSDFSEE